MEKGRSSRGSERSGNTMKSREPLTLEIEVSVHRIKLRKSPQEKQFKAFTSGEGTGVRVKPFLISSSVLLDYQVQDHFETTFNR